MIKIGTYRHYSGHMYKVLATGHQVLGKGGEERVLEEVVIYHALFKSEKYGENHFWVRSVQNFTEKVIVNDKSVSRFTYTEEV